jgi:hypothetical protein
MSSRPKYALLLSKRSSLESVHVDLEREEPLQRCDSSHAFFHWLVHALSVVIIFGLLFATNKLYTFKGCLTHFNAYCSFVDTFVNLPLSSLPSPLFLPTNPPLFNSPAPRSAHPDLLQLYQIHLLSVVPLPFQRSSYSRCAGCLAQCNAM